MQTQVLSPDRLRELRGLLVGTTARPWVAFDRGRVRAIMKGKEPPRKDNGYHARRWEEVVAWSGFDGAHVPERYRSPNLHLIVGAVNALPALLDRIEALEAALTPSAETKAALIGEFKFKTCVGFDEDSHEIMAEVTVPWTTTKEIMAAISALATPKQEQAA